MRKYFLLVCLVFTGLMGFAQERWSVFTEFDFVLPYEKNYLHTTDDIKNHDLDLMNGGFLLSSFSLQASVNYNIFEQLSIGVVTGPQTQFDPNLYWLKLGGVLHYYFVDKDYMYIYLQIANNFSLSKGRVGRGENMRLGLGIPLLCASGFNLFGNIFWELNHFDIGGTRPILGSPGEIPMEIEFRSAGVSVGFQF